MLGDCIVWGCRGITPGGRMPYPHSCYPHLRTAFICYACYPKGSFKVDKI